MKYLATALMLALSMHTVQAQVGIGTTTPKAALDIQSTTEGILIPRVALTSRMVAAPVTNPQGGALVNGTMVYNTATAGTSPNNVVPGFYYWQTNQWVAMAGGAAPENPLPQEAWLLTGNAGTNSATHFIGTTDNQDLVFRTNGNKKFSIATATNQLLSSTSGAVSSPSYSWEASPNYGFYMASGSNIRVATGGVNRLQFPNAAQVHAMSDGTAALPFYSWSNATTTGMFKTGNTINAKLAFATNGIERMRMTEAGYVGVGTQTPTTKLEVNGAIAINEGAVLAFVNGLNGAFYAPANNTHGYYRISGPTAAFSLGGLQTALADGQIITLQNSTPQSFTIINEFSGVDATQRIVTPGGEPLVLRGQHSSVTFQYSKTLNRWTVLNYTTQPQPQQQQIVTHTVKGTTDVNQYPDGSYHPLSQMEVTFTPQNSRVYANFSVSGNMQEGGSWSSIAKATIVTVRLVNANTGAVLGGSTSVSSDYSYDNTTHRVATGWNTNMSMYPIDVTPGVPITLRLEWRGHHASGGVNIQNHAASQPSYCHRSLTIIDQP